MEKSIDLYSFITEKLEIDVKDDTSTYSPLTLAYIGDVVYEIIIRTKIVSEGNAQVNKLHQRSSNLVKAETQAKLIRLMKEELTEEELSAYKRGRNAKSYTSAKHATISDYRTATGFEALMGYLYLRGESDRMLEIVKKGLEKLDEEKLDEEN